MNIIKNKIDKKNELLENNRKAYQVVLGDTSLTHSEKELSEKIKLIDFTKYLKENENNEDLIKLFTVSIDEETKELIKLTISGRNLVAKRNKLPAYMLRSNQDSIDVKSITSEIVFSFLLREMNGGYKCKLETPELNTITPNKDKPDYIITHNDTKLLFDMKSQCNSSTININKKAHVRAVDQGLKFYIVGFIDNDNLDELSKISFYYFSLKYFDKTAIFVNNGAYSSSQNNDYYKLKFTKEIQSKYIKEETFKKLLQRIGE